MSLNQQLRLSDIFLKQIVFLIFFEQKFIYLVLLHILSSYPQAASGGLLMTPTACLWITLHKVLSCLASGRFLYEA